MIFKFYTGVKVTVYRLTARSKHQYGNFNDNNVFGIVKTKKEKEFNYVL